MEGVPRYSPEDIKKYKRLHLWWDMSVDEGLQNMAHVNSYRTMVVDDTKRLTYAQVNDQATSLALGLVELGLKTGDTVIMHIPNIIECCVVFFALQKIGVIPIMGVPRHGLTEMTYFGNIANAIAWIGPSGYRKTNYLEMLPPLKEKVPSLKYFIMMEEGPERPGLLSYHKIMTQAGKGPYTSKSLDKYSPNTDEPCALIPTGGTTGLPKLVPVTHNVFMAKSFYSILTHDRGPKDIDLVVTPLGHDAGLVRLFYRLIVGGTLVVGNSTTALDIMATVQRERITHLFLVPTLLIDVINEPDRNKYGLSSLKAINSGGAYLAPEVNREARHRLGCLIANNLGMAEGVYLGPRPDYPEEEMIQTVGKPHCPWNTVKILDDLDREAPRGEEGELAGKGPTVFSGYYKADEANRRCFNEEGLFRTGDMARINAQGNYIITGRKKDLINRGGEKVNAEQVEEMLLAIEGVSDAAVVAMPDPRLGEKVCAYLKARRGYAFDLDKVISHLKSMGASVMLLPERVEIIDEMPLTAIGKVDKKELRQRIAEKLAQENK